MNLAANVLVGLVAFLHVWFMVLEMVLVRMPIGQKVFKMTAAEAERMIPLFSNQGLYNGFLVAGLVWGLLHPDPAFGVQLQTFFLGCVVVAGIYGGFTALRSIFLIQALPGAIALAAVWLAHGR